MTLGVEEEYQIIDRATQRLVSRSQPILHKARKELGPAVQPELQLSQIEIATPVCRTLADVRDMLVGARGKLIEAAAQEDCTIAAAGTHPFADWRDQERTPKERYYELEETYEQLAREQLIFGCHVHVGIANRDLSVAVLNRMRVWLAPLLALTANSPFWQGQDTGYASFRTELWSRWPMSGPPHLFDSWEEYEALIHALIQAKTVEDASKIYWDIRIPEKLPTIEIRTTDVCMTIDEAVMLAGLIRALVQTCYNQAEGGEPYSRARPELVQAAHWRAARYGLDGDLIDAHNALSLSPSDLIGNMLNFIRPALEQNGDWDEISRLVQHTLEKGNGATRQRQRFAERGDLADVVAYVCAETSRGIE